MSGCMTPILQVGGMQDTRTMWFEHVYLVILKVLSPLLSGSPCLAQSKSMLALQLFQSEVHRTNTRSEAIRLPCQREQHMLVAHQLMPMLACHQSNEG